MKTLTKTSIFSLAVIVALGAFSELAISKGMPADKQSNKPQKQWYLSNTVSVIDMDGTEYKGINAAIMGKLTESSDGYDKHDITPFVSLTGSKAAVYFIQNNWGNRSGEYHSDYHSVNAQNDSWVMTIVSTVKGGKVTLNWDGLYALTSNEHDNGLITYQEKRTLDSRTLDNLHLIDLETLEVIEAVSAEGELNSYTFYMKEGKTSRQFRWVLGSINASYFEPASGAMQYIREHQPEVVRQRRGVKQEGKFGLPPG